MIHHLSIGVSDLARSAAFYDAVLGALGHGRHMEKPGTVSWRPADGGAVIWINQRDGLTTTPDNGNHDAFRAADNDAVDRFYAAALAAGAGDDGLPGFSPEYRDTYYGALVLDPVGHKIEDVHMPVT